MAKRTGLGKGLGAIFGDEVMESAAEEQEAKHQAKSKRDVYKRQPQGIRWRKPSVWKILH